MEYRRSNLVSLLMRQLLILKRYPGWQADSSPYVQPPPVLIAWATDYNDNGFVDGTEYTNPDIICHKAAKPAQITAPVKAGGKVTFQWTPWPTSHHGPVITYMAPCNGNCSTVDKTTLEFFKVDQGGLLNDNPPPGTWETDVLISQNNSYTITVPTGLKPGGYVIRHEIIALHTAQQKDGAQNYPQCISVTVSGSGSELPSGTLGTALYHDTDPGLEIDIYESISSYTIPGPAMPTF
jgi:hypothetical protein